MKDTAKQKVDAVTNDYKAAMARNHRRVIPGTITLYGYMNKCGSLFSDTAEQIRTIWEYGDMTDFEYFQILFDLADYHTKEQRKTVIEYRKKYC